MTLIANPYCTAAEIIRRAGKESIVAYSDHDRDEVADDEVINDAINEATETVNLYCRPRGYSVTALAASTLINRWTVVLAWYFLSINRGNPPPDALAVEYEKILKALESILAGAALPGVATSNRPGMSNLTIDRRYPYSKIRKIKSISTDQTEVLDHKIHSPDYPQGTP